MIIIIHFSKIILCVYLKTALLSHSKITQENICEAFIYLWDLWQLLLSYLRH